MKEKWNKRSCLKPPMNADARRCSAPLIGVDRRASAVPYPRRYEVCSLLIKRLEHTSERARRPCHDGFVAQPSLYLKIRRFFGKIGGRRRGDSQLLLAIPRS